MKCQHVLLGITLASLSGAAIAAKTLDVPSKSYPAIVDAMIQAKSGDTISLAAKTYRENLTVTPGVSVVCRAPSIAVIDGKKKGVVVTLEGNSTISGLEIRQGVMGVQSKGSGNRIVGCRIIKNRESGVVCVGHLPEMKDNVIAYNGGSGIQGWDLRATVFPAIVQNTIVYNGNHGIAVGGTVDIGIQANIIAFNERFGLKIAEESVEHTISGNVFYGNGIRDPGLYVNNENCNPAFVKPRKMNFELSELSNCDERHTNEKPLGAGQQRILSNNPIKKR